MKVELGIDISLRGLDLDFGLSECLAHRPSSSSSRLSVRLGWKDSLLGRKFPKETKHSHLIGERPLTVAVNNTSILLGTWLP